MRKPLVAGNWKMNGDRSGIKRLLDEILAELDESDLKHCEVLVFPTHVHLSEVVATLAGSMVAVGAQDVDSRDSGAFTGAVSAAMVADIGCSHALVGHSERRTLFGESNEIVAAKYSQCLRSGLIPVLCVGETLEERESGLTLEVVARQLEAVVELVGSDGIARGMVAYEPVWAIGTGLSASPRQAEEVHGAMREKLRALDDTTADSVRLLYGGSVNAENAEALFAMENVDGALVGGASLNAKSFLDICKFADAAM